ncbi:MAG: carboxypeptidase regulatory-like domain-containing protein [Candidatus Hydrogenedentes bacterium]|nr:carboxypeptidase regulatory-like domain-containing protein [Candidatus Hydrogenedentota bacterium]
MRRISGCLAQAACIALMASGCGSGSGDLANAKKESAPSQAAAAPEKQEEVALARVFVVDMEGNPLPNMLPIATSQPNAFEKPVAQGKVTGPDGKGFMSIPQNQWLYVRAWDPTKRMFANNYFDVLPGKADTTDEMQIVMLPGASLDAILMDSDGNPIANEDVGMMMSHPTRGQWWPDESKTNERGAIRFESVPAGKYQVTLETKSGKQIQLPEVALPPGGSASLGAIALQ